MDFILKDKNGNYIATAQYLGTGESKAIANEIVILEGSYMAKSVNRTKKWQECSWLDEIRNELILEGYVENHDEKNYRFIKSTKFSSPNKAACTVLGYMTTSAWDDFINEKGETLRTVYKSIDKMKTDKGAKFVVDTLSKALELAETKPELKPLLGKVRREYHFVKDAKKTGDLYDYFDGFRDNTHSDAEAFTVFNKYNLTTNEEFAETLERDFPDELNNKTRVSDFIRHKYYTNNDLRRGFKVSYQGGIRVSNKTNTIVLVAKKSNDSLNNKRLKGFYYYTGQEQNRSESFKRGNKSLFEAKNKGKTIHFFELVDGNKYFYHGPAEVVGTPYFDEANIIEDIGRPVFKIRLL